MRRPLYVILLCALFAITISAKTLPAYADASLAPNSASKQLKKIHQKDNIILSESIGLGLMVASTISLAIILGYVVKTIRKTKHKNKLYLKQIELLKNNNQVKDELFSVVAHDLRGPLTQVVSLLNVMDAGDITVDEMIDILPEIKQNTKNTLDLVDNLLVWAKNQLQGYNFNPVKFATRPIVQSVIDKMDYAFAQKNLTVINAIPAEMNLYADPDMITIIVRNLVSNAVKFTPEKGTIRLDGRIGSNWGVLSVTDSGVGISWLDRKKILSKKSHTTVGTANEKGTGLGLKICREFAELNHGRISIKSRKDVGSKFSVSLPVAKPVKAVVPVYQQERLVVDQYGTLQGSMS